MIRIAILSLSMLTVMSGAAVAPAVADIIAYFPNASDMLGKMVLTTPALTIIPMALITGLLSSRVARKSLVYTGIFFYMLGGAGGGLATSIPFLLSMRAVLGIGVGILMPLSTGIIADIWSGDEKAKIMGLASASSNLGGIIAMLLSGMLAAVSWRASFLIYLLGIAVWVLIFFFLPEKHPSPVEKRQSSQGIGFLGSYIRWGLGMFLLMVAFYSIPVNIALYLQSHEIGDSRMAGLAMAVMTASSFLTGLTYGNLKKALRGWLSSVSLLIFALSYYGLSTFPSALPLFCSLVLNGMAFGTLVPSIMDGVTRTAENSSGTAGTSVVTSFLFAGQFASPLITGETSGLIFGSGISNIYLTLACGVGLACIFSVVFRITTAKRVQLTT
ncbi:MFS transporter [Maridesulfovibrio sp. FT414]|uniref:MFS transporter n=1 Tax=Maridesulfovibrio sp. FT414 TaxID=2979469 RepID=UPI003D806545